MFLNSSRFTVDWPSNKGIREHKKMKVNPAVRVQNAYHRTQINEFTRIIFHTLLSQTKANGRNVAIPSLQFKIATNF